MAANFKKQEYHEVDRSIKPIPAIVGNKGELIFDYDKYFKDNEKYYASQSSDSSKTAVTTSFGKMN